MTRITRGIVLCGALGVAGCGTDVTYSPVSAPPAGVKPRAGNDVEVFMSEWPKGTYREIGYLEAQQQSVYSKDDKAVMLEKLREEAGEKGCDAIYVFDPTKGATSDAEGVNQIRIYRASCIVYTR